MGKRDKRKKRRPKKPRESRGPAPDKLPQPKVKLEALDPYRWRARKQGAMRVPGLIFGDAHIMDDVIREKVAQQVVNVATLPGIVGQAIAMPDIHWGYGFPIGGVAAFDAREGVVSPGGIGYDINCGVRLIASELSVGELTPHLSRLIDDLQQAVPAGLGSKRRSEGLTPKKLDQILSDGARAAVALGFGEAGDLPFIEDEGAIEGADPSEVSSKARERGEKQLGTLGSGNHFVEIQRVATIFEEQAASVLGLFKGQLVVMIHTGSRGLGHQVCTDAVQSMGKAARKAGIALADRQLACAPLGTEAASSYLAAMAAAANFAFANRQAIAHFVRTAIEKSLGLPPVSHGFRTVYDVAHNIAKFETHRVDGAPRSLLVHRKGATRALGPGDPLLPEPLKGVGQPVLVPGDMGRASWVLVGRSESAESFSSSCHGAGRKLSRSEALRRGKGRNLAAELAEKGIVARAASRRTLLEEMPEAYKNVDRVVEVVSGAGLCRPVARLLPLGVIKG